jgi:hypothetical protein
LLLERVSEKDSVDDEDSVAEGVGSRESDGVGSNESDLVEVRERVFEEVKERVFAESDVEAVGSEEMDSENVCDSDSVIEGVSVPHFKIESVPIFRVVV